MSLEDLRAQVCRANQSLLSAGLVTVHSGNVSALDVDSGQLLIKPSGMDYAAMTSESMVAVDVASGQTMTGEFKPSVDLPHHLYLYRNMPEIRAIVHTHSNYATAFAAVGQAIPACLTAICDEFGGEIPCAPYTGNQDEEIGAAILKHRNGRAPAILLASHGVFTWGTTIKGALKAAIMVEDVAKTVWLAKQIGEPQAIPQSEIDRWYDRYQNRYGQN